MCGITGIVNVQYPRAKIGKMTEVLKHRGPDQQSAWVHKHDTIALGHTRLAILDLSEKGKQPMQYKHLRIVFNGEIFNFKELRTNLEQKGYTFESNTDTEVLLKGYDAYKEKILDQLNGQFSFAIYDDTQNTLFLARDRIGINPLYYYYDTKEFGFASELKSIMQVFPRIINTQALYYYTAFGYTPRTQTILNSVYKLEAGHFMYVKLDTLELTNKPYWEVHYNPKITDKQEAKQRLLEELDKSVQQRLVADVPVGAFLSGGVDSSAIVALASKHKKNLNTFSVSFDHDAYDESKHAQTVAQQYATNHHTLPFTAKDVKDLIPQLPYIFDEPFADPSMVPTYFVAQVARKHVTVSLSGDGADEILGGYSFYKTYKQLKLQTYPSLINKAAYSVVKSLKNPLSSFVELGSLSKQHKIARLRSYLTMREFSIITGQKPHAYYEQYTQTFHESDPITELASVEIHNYLSENNQVKVDRASLANSLESRPPFLDHNVVTFAQTLHPTLKHNIYGKDILKYACEDLLPKDILYRKKQGFAMPILHYVRHELKDLCIEMVCRYDKHDYFNKKYLAFLEKQLHKSSWSKDYSRIIWAILMFNLWYDRWIVADDNGVQ